MSRFAWNRRPLGQAGSVSLELAASALVLFGLLFATLDLGRYYFTAQSVRELAGEVARAAAIDSALQGCTAPRSLAGSIPMLSNPAKLTVCVNRPVAASGPSIVTITVSYRFNFSFWLLQGRVSAINETTRLTLP